MMTTYFAGFGFSVYRISGRYYTRDNGYTCEVTRAEARDVAQSFGIIGTVFDEIDSML